MLSLAHPPLQNEFQYLQGETESDLEKEGGGGGDNDLPCGLWT